MAVKVTKGQIYSSTNNYMKKLKSNVIRSTIYVESFIIYSQIAQNIIMPNFLHYATNNQG